MKAIALARVDPSIVAGLLAAFLVLAVLGSSQTVLRLVRLTLETVWLYLSNTRG